MASQRRLDHPRTRHRAHGERSEDVGAQQWCQAWDCRNLFVTDGGPFVSQADKNPTWTIMALAMRTADKILEIEKGRDNLIADCKKLQIAECRTELSQAVSFL
jgi:choline dehydrogenase-like flavoprotein